MILSIGDNAPNFTLRSSDMEEVTLSDLKGSPVLLLFFPLSFSNVCTVEVGNVRDSLHKYEDMDAKVFGISVDSPFALAKFKESQDLNFPLLSDFNKEASEAYGVLYEDFFGMKGVSKRSAFVVDAEGKIAFAEVLEDASNEPDYEAIQKSLRELK